MLSKTVNFSRFFFSVSLALALLGGMVFSAVSANTAAAEEQTMVTAGQEIIEPIYYTVWFLDWNGEVLERQEVPYRMDAIPPADPKREGYTFTGWSGEYTDIMSEATLYAQYRLGEDIGEKESNTTMGVIFLGAVVAIWICAFTFIKIRDSRKD